MQAALRVGAAYVPVDPMSPPARAATIMDDCSVAALVSTVPWSERVLKEDLAAVPTITTDAGGTITWADLECFSAEAGPDPGVDEDDLAYILYTSGSTGRPKGVCLSHRNALAFVHWAADEVRAEPGDHFSSHAPFHFDLSVFDLYATFRSGGRMSIIPEASAYEPQTLVEFVHREQITVWYSVPSALILMMERGGMLDGPPLPLRIVIFAGEPFPLIQLRRLIASIPGVRFFNWYGPTETNVCTSYEVTSIPTEPVPIGQASSGNRVWARNDQGMEAAVGEEGELYVDGPTVLLGYWGKPPHGKRPYATGDLVRRLPDGNYEFVGRRDQMVKVRGHRVELGEVEAALLSHPDVREAAVVVAGLGLEARLVAFLACRSDPPPPLLEFKRHCAERVARYMIVDRVRHLPALPRTGNGKVDRLKLMDMAQDIGGSA